MALKPVTDSNSPQIQSLVTANEQMSARLVELEKRNFDLEQKMNVLTSMFTSLLQFQNTQDQSEMPLYQVPVVPINSSEDTPPPGFSRSPRTTFDEKVASAKHFLTLKDYFCAGAYIDQAIELNPENAKAFAIKSKICRVQGDFVGSLQAAGKAIKINPDNLMALVNKAVALRFLHNFDEALMTSEAALSLRPWNQLALRCKFDCQYHLRRPVDSLATIELTLKRFPNDPLAKNIRGLIFFEYPHLRTMARQQ